MTLTCILLNLCYAADNDKDSSPWTPSRKIVGNLQEKLFSMQLPVHPVLVKFAIISQPKPQSPSKAAYEPIGNRNIRPAIAEASIKTESEISSSKHLAGTSVSKTLPVSASEAPLPKRASRSQDKQPKQERDNSGSSKLASAPASSNDNSTGSADRLGQRYDKKVKSVGGKSSQRK
jgi:hypothetical protein